MQGELSFSSDCVIRFQDLGQFVDYSQKLQLLKASLEAIIAGKNSNPPEQLWEVINADPEDTFFLPDFQNVLELMTKINWRKIIQGDLLVQFYSFYFKIIEEGFFSYSISEDIIQSMLKTIKIQQKAGMNMQGELLKLLYKLSDKIIYIDQPQKLLVFWEMIKEKEVFKFNGLPQNVNMIAAVYSHCCQKHLRNKQLRNMNHNLEDKPFFGLKLALWKRDKGQTQRYYGQLQKIQFYQSDYLQDLSKMLVQKLKEII